MGSKGVDRQAEPPAPHARASTLTAPGLIGVVEEVVAWRLWRDWRFDDPTVRPWSTRRKRRRRSDQFPVIHAEVFRCTVKMAGQPRMRARRLNATLAARGGGNPSSNRSLRPSAAMTQRTRAGASSRTRRMQMRYWREVRMCISTTVAAYRRHN